MDATGSTPYALSDFDNRKLTGPILDVDYELDSAAPRVPSLQDLCGKRIVSDSYITRRYLAVMPSKIKSFVMRTALAEARFLTVSILLKKWPYSIFKFPQLPILKEWLFSCSCPDWLRFSKRLRNALQCASIVLNTFLEIVWEDSPETKLRVLDLSAAPLSENSVLKICNFISDNDASQPNNVRARSGSAVAKYAIKAHCTFENSKVVEALHSALAKDEMGLSVIKFCVSGLTFGNKSLHTNGRSLDLMHAIGPADLQVVSFNFPRALPKTLADVLSCLARFHNLRVLDLSYIPAFAVGTLSFISMQNLLRELVHVSRVDVSNCNIRDGVELLLGQLYHSSSSGSSDSNSSFVVYKKSKVVCSNPHCQGFPRGNLEYLNLSGCRLSHSDLEYLANSSQVWSLKNLNLSCNSLGDKFNSLLTLLRSVAPTLRVLEIADTYYTNEQMGELVSVLSKMENLCFLNISNPRVSPQALLYHLPELSRLPCLKKICLCVPQSVPPAEFSDFRTKVVNTVKYQERNIDLVWQH